MEIKIRKAYKSDVPEMMKLVKELAAFEKAPEEVVNTEERMHMEGFNDVLAFEALVAEVDGKIQGTSIYYFSYSTWKGRCMYLDDLVVREAFRGKGIGTALFKATIQVAKKEKVGKLDWQVLDWNQEAINFYKKFNPSSTSEWINCSIDKKGLEQF